MLELILKIYLFAKKTHINREIVQKKLNYFFITVQMWPEGKKKKRGIYGHRPNPFIAEKGGYK